MPKLIAVQSAHCAPLTPTWTGKPSATIAEGIAIAEPARAAQIVQCIKKTGGDILTVDDDETRNAQKLMAEMGFYIEPTSATAIAAYVKYPSEKDEIVVAPLTGHGLKNHGEITITPARKFSPNPHLRIVVRIPAAIRIASSGLPGRSISTQFTASRFAIIQLFKISKEVTRFEI